MQACWFIVQVAGRLITSHPTTLLGMNTLLHAICCLVIYLAWWDSSFNIDEFEIIRSKDELSRKAYTWMMMSSNLGAHKQLRFDSSQDNKVGKTAYLVFKQDIC